MCSLRATLRAVTLANREKGYIVVLILTGYAKADKGIEKLYRLTLTIILFLFELN